jgi:heptose-I-phosphate ethanolaminephosphotransferase
MSLEKTILRTIRSTIHRKQAACFLLFMLLLFGIRLIFPGDGCWTYHKKAILTGAFLFTFQYTFLWDGNRKWFWGNCLYACLYLVPVLLQHLVGQHVDGKGVVDACLSGMAVFWGGTSLCGLSRETMPWWEKKLLGGAGKILLGAGLLLPLLLLGYYGVSGHLLSADIVLTLFQTNLNESLSYLRDQNLLLWGGIFLGMGLVGVLFFLEQKKLGSWVRPNSSFLRIGCVLLLLAGEGWILKQSENYPAFRIGRETREVLKDYHRYGQAKQQRLERLHQLGTLKTGQNGVYVLVIGESESRDRMGAYGYERQNTPWLSSVVQQPGNLLFTHAYSNHTHTVPVLTYALSQKNQYNSLKLKDACSILEVARAAGFTTYWISNQRKLGGYDTPVAEIASTAEHQVWKNDRYGTKDMEAPYFDQVLVDALPDIQPGEKTLIVLHVMGCHGAYEDRYPKAFARYSGGSVRTDAYDNAVLYGDWVLEQIYGKVSSYPGFQAMVYVSDHGEDPAGNRGHEATKFTWTMSHIPLVILTSGEFRTLRPKTCRTLEAHRERYWTNDLLYNLMVDLMDIQGMPGEEPELDLASPQYEGEPGNLRTLHGKKRLMEE